MSHWRRLLVQGRGWTLKATSEEGTAVSFFFNSVLRHLSCPKASAGTHSIWSQCHLSAWYRGEEDSLRWSFSDISPWHRTMVAFKHAGSDTGYGFHLSFC